MDKNGIPERLWTLRYPVFTRKKNNECDKLEVIYFYLFGFGTSSSSYIA